MSVLSPKEPFGLSTLRLWVMRVPYFLTGVLFGITAWSTLFEFRGEFEPTEGVAYAFWGALSFLALIGLLHPVKMLPVLVLQFLYKGLWLLFVGLPLLGIPDAHDEELFMAMAVGLVIDVVAIPWPFALRKVFARA